MGLYAVQETAYYVEDAPGVVQLGDEAEMLKTQQRVVAMVVEWEA
jgi:hypothetical protein